MNAESSEASTCRRSALGCMSMTPIYGEPDPDEAIATIQRAPEVGIDFIDTSDAYGADGSNEELVGRALKGRRDKVRAGDEVRQHPPARRQARAPTASPTTCCRRAKRA